MAAESGNLLQTFFSRLGFEVDAKGLDEYESKLVGLSKTLLKFSGIASLTLGGLFEMTRSSTEQLAQIEKMSQTYDLATETIAAFNRMGREVGITTESMMDGIAHLNVAMGAVARGQGRYLTRILKELGLTVKDSSGKMKDMRTFLGDVAERMKTMGSAERNLLVTRLGLDPGMVRLMRNGREEFEKLYDTASKGLPFTDEDYKKAEEFEVAFTKAKAAVGVMSSEIGLSLMPIFQRAMDKFLAWWKSNGEYVMQRIRYWVGVLTDLVGSLLDFIEELTDDSNLLADALKAVGTAVGIVVGYQLGLWAYGAANAIAELASQVLLATKVMLGFATEEEAAAAAALLANIEIVAIVAAFAALAAGVLLVINDFETWRKGGRSVIGGIMAWLDSLSGKAKTFATFFTSLFADMWAFLKQSLGASLDSLIAMFKAWWPIIKVVLAAIGIAIVVALGIAFLAITALVTAFAWLGNIAAKVVAVIGELFLLPWFGPGENMRRLGAWFSTAFEWVKNKIGEFGQFMLDEFTKLAKLIGDFFVNLIQLAIDEAIYLMTVGISKLVEKVGGAAAALWDTIRGKTDEATTAAIEQQRAAAAMPPPTIATQAASTATVPTLSPTQEAALTMATQHQHVDASKTNSDNITTTATINVRSAEEATQTVMKLNDKAAKKRHSVGRNLQQTSY